MIAIDSKMIKQEIPHCRNKSKIHSLNFEFVSFNNNTTTGVTSGARTAFRLEYLHYPLISCVGFLCSIFSNVASLIVTFLLDIMVSDPIPSTAFDYHFGIFKLFLIQTCSKNRG